MKKTKFLVLVGIVGLFFALIFGIISSANRKSHVLQPDRDLRKLALVNLDSLPIEYPEIKSRLVLIFFNTECDYCQNEMNELNANFEKIASANIILVSSERINTIEPFMATYGFIKRSNLIVGNADSDAIYREFGQLNMPHTFVYDSNWNLIKEFKGQTEISKIAEYL